jgi:hypothetical protein
MKFFLVLSMSFVAFSIAAMERELYLAFLHKQATCEDIQNIIKEHPDVAFDGNILTDSIITQSLFCFLKIPHDKVTAVRDNKMITQLYKSSDCAE